MKCVIRTQVRIPLELYNDTKEIAEQDYISMNSVIIKALSEYIKSKKADCIRQDNQSALVTTTV